MRPSPLPPPPPRRGCTWTWTCWCWWWCASCIFRQTHTGLVPVCRIQLLFTRGVSKLLSQLLKNLGNITKKLLFVWAKTRYDLSENLYFSPFKKSILGPYIEFVVSPVFCTTINIIHFFSVISLVTTRSYCHFRGCSWRVQFLNLAILNLAIWEQNCVFHRFPIIFNYEKYRKNLHLAWAQSLGDIINGTQQHVYVQKSQTAQQYAPNRPILVHVYNVYTIQ